MYLSKIQITHFRKIKSIDLELNKGLNLFVGENDSGKSAIIDAIKFVLGTHSNDWLRLEKDDFYFDGKTYATEIKIICIFKNLSENESAMFLEWLSIENHAYYLKITFKAKRKEKSNSINQIFYDIKAGEDEESGVMSGEAKNKLKVTYLKPLRDAEYELAPRKGSRLSQILANYDIFQIEQGKSHKLVDIMNLANISVNEYFEKDEGKEILETINEKYLKDFSLTGNGLRSRLDITQNELGRILEKLELRGVTESEVGNLGLGSNNLLFIAAEMLLLKDQYYTGLKLSLIEEIEAHLHPQSQINLIDFLNKQSENLDLQTIITTHSNSLASKVDLNNLIICKNGKAFSLRKGETKLNGSDYGFLKRFLDDTKANLFFANGLIIVEGDAENLLLPTFADFIGIPLHKNGISIVNVGSTALLRYAKIFLRSNTSNGILEIPVSVVTDLDIKPKKYFEEYEDEKKVYELSQENIEEINTKFTALLKTDFSSLIGIQYSSKLKLEADFKSLIPKELKMKTKIGEALSKLLQQKKFNLEDLPEIRNSTYIKKLFEDQKVKYFVGTDWTLEYLLALSCLKNLFYEAILLAKLFLVSDDLDDDEIIIETEYIRKKVNEEIAVWEEEKTSPQIAYEIYWKTMQGNGKTKTSKAVVSQCLSKLLEREKNNKILKDNVNNDMYLKYLVDAIKHAANV